MHNKWIFFCEDVLSEIEKNVVKIEKIYSNIYHLPVRPQQAKRG